MYVYKAKLDRIIDGDTVDAVIDLGFDVSVHKRIRLAGIDTPESRTRDLEEKERGLASKARLEEMLKGGEFILESKEVGKYGRVLGTLFVEKISEDNLTAEPQTIQININETLVREGYAVEYWGGKKKKK
jgi:micrococcal nuclease|tara:strand:+ start:448 stop:837 length:390 start_codon:yes stop_codon:yes gene_type:complete